MDIITPKGIDILAFKRVAYITSCDIEAPIKVLSTGPLVRRVVSAKKAIVIPPQSIDIVAIHYLTLLERDFLFELYNTKLSIYTSLVDNDISLVLVKNESKKAIKIPRNMRLEKIREVEFNRYYYILSGQEDVAELATRRPQVKYQGSQIKRVFKKVIAALAITLLATSTSSIPYNPPNPDAISNSIGNSTPPAIEITPTPLDYILSNSITIYSNVLEFTNIVSEFLLVQKEEGFADIL